MRKKTDSKKRMISYSTKKKIYGLMFIAPWLLGFLCFFAVPFIQTVSWSFMKLETSPTGYVTTWLGLENYQYAFFRDTTFIRSCVESLTDLIQIPLIIVYSICFALLLKGNYPGRGLMRAIAFLPVIVGSGVIMQIMQEDVFSSSVKGGDSVYLFSSGGIDGILTMMGMNSVVMNYVNQVISAIFDLTWRSGVQILLFLAGLHNIQGDVYEAASIDGARAFEKFFKITLPLLTPMIVVNVVYSVIDLFSDYGNEIIQTIYSAAFDSMRFGYSSAMAVIYFAMVSVVLGIVFWLLNKVTVKQDF